MGYTTDFEGRFAIRPSMKKEHIAYINKFSETRRMKRDASITIARADPLRSAVGLPLGVEGGYFVGAKGDFGQEYDAPDVVDGNCPPTGQVGLWCKWIIKERDGHQYVEWSGMEKFYGYIQWAQYLIKHFFEPWGYHLDGTVLWYGEEYSDTGRILVTDNRVIAKRGDYGLPIQDIDWDAWNEGDLNDGI